MSINAPTGVHFYRLNGTLRAARGPVSIDRDTSEIRARSRLQFQMNGSIGPDCEPGMPNLARATVPIAHR